MYRRLVFFAALLVAVLAVAATWYGAETALLDEAEPRPEAVLQREAASSGVGVGDVLVVAIPAAVAGAAVVVVAMLVASRPPRDSGRSDETRKRPSDT